MCTLTWYFDPHGYNVFFNRDEQKKRAKALPPRILEENIKFVMPIDPQGGGSWISTNQYGVTVALLNFYQGNLPSGPLYSRGQIIKQLAPSLSLEEATRTVKSIDLTHYAPFSVAVFCPGLHENKSRVGVIRWDGQRLQDYTSPGPLISSGVSFESVSKARLKAYRDLINTRTNDKTQAHIDYHSSHIPNQSAESVCMHREDAQTVSLSHVSVTSTESKFCYIDGSPCEHEFDYTVRIKRLAPSKQSAKTLRRN